MITRLLHSLATCALLATSLLGADYDLRIVNARIADGTGAPVFKGEIGIKDGKIAFVGAAGGSAAATMDAASVN